MIPPVRCFTCNAPLSALWYELQECDVARRHARLMEATRRYCCRMLIMTSDDLTAVETYPNFVTHSERHMMDLETTITHARTSTAD